MAVHNLAGWQHTHAYDSGNRAAERRTWIVVAITAVTMVAEIVAGYLTGSMVTAVIATTIQVRRSAVRFPLS